MRIIRRSAIAGTTATAAAAAVRTIAAGTTAAVRWTIVALALRATAAARAVAAGTGFVAMGMTAAVAAPETAVGAGRREAGVAGAGAGAARLATTTLARRTTRARGAIAAVAGEPRAHRGQFLARRHAALVLLAEAGARAALGPRHVAVHFAAGRALLLAAARRLFADAVVGAQLARFVVMGAAPAAGGAAFGAVLGDVAVGAALVQHRAQGEHGLRRAKAGGLAQLLHGFLVQRGAVVAAQGAWQLDAAVADALEAADQEALRIPQPAHFAVAALTDHHAEPAVAAAAADHGDLVEAGGAVFQFHAGLELLDHLVGHFAVHAAEVFALDAAARMHQRVGQLAVGGEQQQAGGVDVEATHGDPARALQARQLLEHGGATFGIVAGGQHALGLVVDQHLGVAAVVGGDHELLAVDHHAVARVHAGADGGRAAVEFDLTGLDALFQHAARAEAGVGEHLVQALLQRRGVAGRRALEGKGGFFRRSHARCSSGILCGCVVFDIRGGRCLVGSGGFGFVCVLASSASAADAAASVSAAAASASCCGTSCIFVAGAASATSAAASSAGTSSPISSSGSIGRSLITRAGSGVWSKPICGSSMSRISDSGGNWSSDFRLK